jgi:hypothetical protein
MHAAMIVLVHARVRRAEWAFLALLERIRLGRYRGGWHFSQVAGPRLSVPGEAVSGEAASGEVTAPVVPDRGRLPRRFGWLMAVMPYEAAGYASQLRTVLAEPEMVAVLADVPQARRILRSVCQMLGVEIPGVGPVVRAERASVPVRAKRARSVVDWGRIPLPRGVLAAARRQGYGRVPVLKGG